MRPAPSIPGDRIQPRAGVALSHAFTGSRAQKQGGLFQVRAETVSSRPFASGSGLLGNHEFKTLLSRHFQTA